MSELQETYDFLLGPRRISDEIWRKDLRRQELRACLLPIGITYDKDPVQTSPEDSVAGVMAEVADLDQQIEELQHRKAQSIMEISRILDNLDDPREATVLDAYYLGYRSMQQIADHMHYSLRHVYRIRNAGVANMSNMSQPGAV
jgi:DNA-directed RNA polymerase specialized sigma24 family protein